jgi:hypothetical protein
MAEERVSMRWSGACRWSRLPPLKPKTHFTIHPPMNPGTMRRTGKPWSGTSGSPFYM